MVRFIKAKVLLFIICFSLAGVGLFAQNNLSDYDDIFLYAQMLKAGGAYEEAEVELKRYIFLQDYSKGKYQTQAFTCLCELYSHKEQWELASQAQEMAIQSALEDGLSEQEMDQLRLTHIKCLSNAAEVNNEALGDNLFIFSYMQLGGFSNQVRQAALCAVLNNELKRQLWLTAEKQYSYICLDSPFLFNQEEKQTIETGLNQIKNYKPKKQLLAGYLSFFPGLGQLYAGNPKDSLNAFLLNGSLIALSAWSICTMDFWTFSLLEFNPLFRFMKGNIYNAQKDAYEYNTAKISGFTAPVFASIEQAQNRLGTQSVQ